MDPVHHRTLTLLKRVRDCAELNQDDLEADTEALLDMVDAHMATLACLILARDRGIGAPGPETVRALLDSL